MNQVNLGNLPCPEDLQVLDKSLMDIQIVMNRLCDLLHHHIPRRYSFPILDESRIEDPVYFMDKTTRVMIHNTHVRFLESMLDAWKKNTEILRGPRDDL